MVKRVFKDGAHQVNRMIKWVRCLKYKSHRKQSDHRAVAMAVHAVHTSQLGRRRLNGGHDAQPAAPSPDPAGTSVASHREALEAELDRIFEGRPHAPQKGGRRILAFTCPGGNS